LNIKDDDDEYVDDDLYILKALSLSMIEQRVLDRGTPNNADG
jgi:hypothetical protein